MTAGPMGGGDAQVDEGYFPQGRSVLRRVHDERLVGLFYGQRSLCVGALAPLNFVGTSEHTKARETPWKRLVQTGKVFETIYFGTRAEADRALASVRNIHEQVNGRLGEHAGKVPKGTRYSALDPEQMLWTVAAMVDSALCFYELFIRHLSAPELEAFWQDYVRFAVLFGMPRSDAPPTYPEFRAWWRAKLASDEMFLTPEARQVGYEMAFEIPLPPRDQRAKRVHDLIMLGSLPERARELYKLDFSPAQVRRFRTTVAALRAGRRLTPGRLAKGPCARLFERVEETEQWRIDNGVPTPQLWPRAVASRASSR